MRKNTLIIFGVLIILLVAGLSNFYWKHLRGARPAFSKPKGDIVKLIKDAQNAAELADGESEASFPLEIPDGFTFSVYADGLVNPRVMITDPNNVLLVSRTKSNDIVALPDRDMDGVVDEVVTVADNLNQPHGLAMKCQLPRCQVYVAETDKVSVFEYDLNTYKISRPFKLVDLPGGGRHFTRTLLFRSPPNENELLISIGSSCDTCYEPNEMHASIWSFDLETLELKKFASGLRNAVFMTNHPKTGDVWATEMGRDFLGDDLPPDEVNIIEEGGNYGWPLCYGKNVHDRVFDDKEVKYIRAPCSEPFEKPSTLNIPAHSSPLGLDFFGDAWGEAYKDDLLVVYHGSWNRTIPTGYKVVRHQYNELGEYWGVEDFVSGWLQPDKSSLGRPADVLIQDDQIFISDDKAGVIYLMKPTASSCVVSGCSGEICSDQKLASICLFQEKFACYKQAVCERQADGECGWTMSDSLAACLEEKSGSGDARVTF